MKSKELEKVNKIVKALGCSYEEAYDIMREDEKIDKMTSIKEIESDLTTEQKQTSKDMRTTTSGKPQARKSRSKVIDCNKRDLWSFISLALYGESVSPKELLNPKGLTIISTTDDKELVVEYGGKKYKITISTPRA